MGKNFTAAEMLGRGRSAARTPAEPKRDGTSTTPLVAESEPVSPPVPVLERVTYEKMGLSLTPDQRRWLKSVTPGLGVEGLSASDVARLAISRLQDDVQGGLPLADLLVEQAHQEAQRLAGRRNRGMPRRAN